MKSFIYILGILIATVCVNCDMPAELKKVFEDCRTELGLPAEKSKGPPNMDDPKCYRACLMKKLDLMKNGKIVVEKIFKDTLKDQPSAGDVKAKITECINKANEQSDECEVADTVHKCVGETMKKLQH